jgi:hypothetical protein
MQPIRTAAYRFGRWNRERKAEFATSVGRRAGATSVLLIGVSGAASPVNDLIEQHLAAAFDWVVASGVNSVDAGWKRFVVADGRKLPFADGSFDLVYANAVIEHVGDREDQQRFVAELARVGRRWIITTPNRYFPIEAHTHTLVTHWFAGWAPRADVTRLLGVRGFRELLPRGGRVRGIPLVSPTLTAVGCGGPEAMTTARSRRGRFSGGDR